MCNYGMHEKLEYALRGDYDALKKLIYCEILFQKFCLYLREEKLVCSQYKVIWSHF